MNKKLCTVAVTRPTHAAVLLVAFATVTNSREI